MLSGFIRSCSLLIMMCLWMTVQAQQVRLEQRYSFDFSDANLSNALKTIENTANIRFSYASSDIPANPIGARFNQVPLYQILQRLLSDHNLTYLYIGENSYVIRKETIEFEFSYQVSGFVRDKETNKPISKVIVSSQDENISVATNDSGFFVLRISQSPQDLVFTYPGYNTILRVANQKYFYYHAVKLERNVLVEVVKKSVDSVSFSLRSTGFTMNFGSMDKNPFVHTSPGVLNSVKFIAGFQSSLDVNGGITVRGGGLDENLVLYDGALVYNPMHLPGWFSIFSKRSVSKAELIKSGFNSSYGGRVSSVIDTRSSQGNMKKYLFGISVSPLATEGYLEGPIIKDKVSFVISGRRTYTDLWSPVLEEILTENRLKQVKFYLYDINGGIDWKTGSDSKLILRIYRGGDKGYLNEKLRTNEELSIREDNNQSYHWSNLITTAEWVKRVNESLNIKLLSYYSKYGFRLDNSYSIQVVNPTTVYSKESNLKYGNDVEDLGNRLQVNYRLTPQHKFMFGADHIAHRFLPPSTEYSNTVNGITLDRFRALDIRIRANEVNSFINYSFSLRKMLINTGLRYSFFQSDREYHVWQPRAMINWYPSPDIKLYAHYDRLNQFIFAVNSSESGLQYTVWVPVSADLDPIQADQYSIGMAKRFNGLTQLILEAYQKNYSTVYDYYNRNIDFLKNWQNQLSKGTGNARGLEMTFRSGGTNWNGWIAYTLSKADRKYDDINNGQSFPFQFNRLHDVSLFANIHLPRNWILGWSWIFASGNYLTIPESRYIIEFEDEILLVENFGSKNNYKLPAYHRLDIGLTKTYEREKFNHRISLSIYNAYFSQNPYYITLSFNEEGKPVINQVNLLPFMPIIQYAIDFK